MKTVGFLLPEDVQYIGHTGVSSSCLRAIVGLIHFGEKIIEAKLLSFGCQHGFLLETERGEVIAIKSGFSSGYSGEGPRTLSTALQLLISRNVHLEEYDVPKSIFDQVNASKLSKVSLKRLSKNKPVRPVRYHDYIGPYRLSSLQIEKLFPLSMPYAIIDPRLNDLALEFFEKPDLSILAGYRRLEDFIRKKSGLTEHGTKLFSAAFNGRDSELHWVDVDGGEQQGRAALFSGTYMAFRNKRAHKEQDDNLAGLLVEFLQLNQLYLLEKKSVKREPNFEGDTGLS